MNAAAATLARSSRHTVLAFDFGEKYLGIAVGDTETRIAQPLGMISAPSDAERLARIDALMREWRPDKLVVGLPLGLDGGERAITARARRFGRRLSARYRLPVDFADERYTSTAAEETLREAGRGGRKGKSLAQALAARLILQSYLDDAPRR